jgi:hypothetical protein
MDALHYRFSRRPPSQKSSGNPTEYRASDDKGLSKFIRKSKSQITAEIEIAYDGTVAPKPKPCVVVNADFEQMVLTFP